MILYISFICVGVSFVLTGVAIFYFAEKRNDTHNVIMSLLHEKAQADIVRILKQRWKHYAQRCMLCLKLSCAIAICGVILSCIGGVEKYRQKKKLRETISTIPHIVERPNMSSIFNEQDKNMWIEIRDKKQ